MTYLAIQHAIQKCCELNCVMAEYLFNVDHGYLEGLVRGFRSGILTRVDYLNLVQCETVDGE